ncbi:MAG: hypothetical protein JW984_14735 [Deltaproteobacteria bacterium]|uniref:Porin n=1 Tax=Candidatus Zymogenus saltonus TaxID=2844893 RepID=A0A9D8KJA2_9DELT|nr:hypothetical protein [Candidatus Zymogenus saltonus]
MKKLMTLALVIVFVATAFSAFATDTTFSGQYRVRAWNEWNFDKKLEDVTALPGHDNAQYDGWFDQRFRLTITHTRSEFLKAVIRFDIVEDTWGQQRNLLINNSGAGNFIDWAYIEFTLPQIGTFTVGKFPETYGYGLAFSDGGTGTIGLTGLRWANAWGPVAASVLYAKVADRVTAGTANVWYNWDANLYAMNLKITPAESHVIELFGGYLQDNDATGVSGVGGALANSWAGSWNLANSPIAVGPGDYRADIGFAGIAYTGTIADMIDIKLENSWIFGHATRHFGPGLALPATVAVDSASISGWNVYADVSYYNDLLRVGVAFIMGSGQHHYWNDAVYDNVNMNYISADEFGFNKIIVGEGGTNSVWRATAGGTILGDQCSIENLTAVKLYFEICPVEKLTLNASVTWAKWTEDVGQNWLGTRAAIVGAKGSAYPHPAARYGNYTYQSWNADDDLGWEIDFGFSYEIMEGLTYSLSAGVLFTGDSWDYEKADGTRGDWGEIWSITNQLLYEF